MRLRQERTEDGFDLWCFGLNSDRSPKHPLNLRADTPLVRWERR